MNAKPFIKWAGGKSQLLPDIRKKYPKELGKTVTKYCEPFVGGGAVLFDVLSNYEIDEVLINDINAELTNTYSHIKHHLAELLLELTKMQDNFWPLDAEKRKEYYYEKRERFNFLKMNGDETVNIEKAALFIFLNKTCFNGLFRVNKKGLFNVPMGSYKKPMICDKSNLTAISGLLQKVTIKRGDYKGCLEFIDGNTFVYIDPPYRPLTATASFTSYAEADFNDREQMELGAFVDSITAKKAKVVISNSDPKNSDEEDTFFDDLYGQYEILRVTAKRMINCNGESRGNVSELLISNFKENDMDGLLKFTSKIKSIMCNSDTVDVLQAQLVVKEINEFLYCNYDGIGKVIELGEEFNYFSDFHKFWHDNYKEILGVTINTEICERVADALHGVFLQTNGKAFSEVYDTNDLSNEDICRVRFLTANQDFRGSREFKSISKVFLNDNSIFDEEYILNNPEEFIKHIGIVNLSQNDKRVQFAKTISQFVFESGKSPFKIIDNFSRDVSAFRATLTSIQGAGYGNKKADMFIRDMVVLGIWNDVTGFEKIDVASDVNTIKVALRTGILSTEIPLVSSFIDIFCYQYGYVDEMNAKAWRKVWEIWINKYPNESISSPCLLDYFIYSVVGKQFCKPSLSVFKCNDEEHTFKWHSSQNRTCQVCYNNNKKGVKATLVYRVMPCLDDDGEIAISKTDFARSNLFSSKVKVCPFVQICKLSSKHYLNTPKSISIKGQTGWTTAYAKKEQGGGGLMA